MSTLVLSDPAPAPTVDDEVKYFLISPSETGEYIIFADSNYIRDDDSQMGLYIVTANGDLSLVRSFGHFFRTRACQNNARTA